MSRNAAWCRFCRRNHVMTWDLTGEGLVEMPALFYQCSYEGEPGHVSPRCHDCYEKAENRWKR